MSALELSEVSVPGRLSAVTAAFAPGTLTALVGPNGSGKSTLLQAAAGVLPAHGTVRWHGDTLMRLSFVERAQRVTWVPQETRFEFNFTVRAVVAQGRFAHGDDDVNVEQALHALDLVELQERPVNQLSGGERQRVLLARALANDAPIQLWDEPIAALDPRHSLEVMRLARAHADKGGTVLLSLHDLRVAQGFDQVMVLHRGGMQAMGRPSEIFTAELLLHVFQVRSSIQPGLSLELP